MSDGPLVVAVLGLGEAGSAIAADLAAAGRRGARLRPARQGRARRHRVRRRRRRGPGRGRGGVADLRATRPRTRWTAALPAMAAGAIYADLNTASSGLKAHLAGLGRGPAGVGFADVALMSPVPGNGLRTPHARGRPRGRAVSPAWPGPLGASVEVLPGPPGAAAERKLVRSVFYKGARRGGHRGAARAARARRV